MSSLRGSVCLYQGEELGLDEADIAFEDLRDPYGVAFWPSFKGRDGCRTPMPWDDSDTAGFTTGLPWLPIPAEHVSFVLILLVAGFTVAVVVALVRGLTSFLKNAEHIRTHGSPAAEAFGVKQNRMMSQRVLFQGIAILLIVLLGSLAS